MKLRIPALVVAAVFLSGCSVFQGLFGMKVDTVAFSAQKPSNVAVYLEIMDGSDPVKGLEAKNFRLFENGTEVPSDTANLRILDRTEVTDERTLLLVDQSGVTTEEQSATLTRSVQSFVQRLRRSQAVSVAGFDGQTQLDHKGDFPRGEDATAPAIAPFKSRDPSRDLHGALVTGLKLLETKLSLGTKPIRLGTLVVFTRGTDLAGRVDDKTLNGALRDTRYAVYGIGLPDPDKTTNLERFAKSGVVRAQSEAALNIAFDSAADKLTDDAGRYYLLSYCSPGRAGTRLLKVEISTEPTMGKDKERTGRVEVKFDAEGFAAGCDSKALPRFSASGAATMATADPKATPEKKPEAAKVPPKKPEGTKPPPKKGDDVVPPPNDPRYAP